MDKENILHDEPKFCVFLLLKISGLELSIHGCILGICLEEWHIFAGYHQMLIWNALHRRLSIAAFLITIY